MAKKLSAECKGFRSMKAISGAISLADIGLSGKKSDSQKLATLEQTCNKCSGVQMDDKNPSAVASECGCLVGFDNLMLCFRHAYSQSRCRRCGCTLPSAPPKKKSKPGCSKKTEQKADRNGIPILLTSPRLN